MPNFLDYQTPRFYIKFIFLIVIAVVSIGAIFVLQSSKGNTVINDEAIDVPDRTEEENLIHDLNSKRIEPELTSNEIAHMLSVATATVETDDSDVKNLINILKN